MLTSEPAMRLSVACLLALVLTGPATDPVRAAPQRGPSQPPRAPGLRTWDEKPLSLPIVGPVVAYVPRTPTPHVVLLVGGERGWTGGVVELARQTAAAPAIVVAVPYRALARHGTRDEGCWYVASDLELISHAAQKALGLPQYHPPVLMGDGPGAAVVYAALAGGPATTFAGAIGLGFCPRLAVRREICAGEDWVPEYDDRKGTNVLPPTNSLPKNWYVLHGTRDRVCDLPSVRRFVSTMARTELIPVEGGGHTFAPTPAWATALAAALQALWTERDVKPPAAQPRSASARELEDELQRLQLPLEFRWPAQISALLLFFSGDGGWASLDEEVAENLVTHNVGVVGVSSLRYFWNAKTPALVAADLRRLVGVLGRSGRPVFAGGFSFGAEVVPVALGEWTPAERRAIAGLVLIAPGSSASFEIDPLDWLRKPAENAATRVAPAVREAGLPALCVAGAEEEDSPCAALAGVPAVRVVRLPGSHHFDNNYTAVADVVNQFIRSVTMDKRP